MTPTCIFYIDELPSGPDTDSLSTGESAVHRKETSFWYINKVNVEVLEAQQKLNELKEKKNALARKRRARLIAKTSVVIQWQNKN